MTHRPLSRELAYALPDEALTRDGIAFCPRDDDWHLRGLTSMRTISFRPFRELCPTLVPSMKLTLLWYARTHSLPYLGNTYAILQSFIRAEHGRSGRAIASIGAPAILAFRATAPSHAVDLGKLRPSLLKWAALGLPGIESDALSWLKRMRLPGNAKGVAVATMDPRTGPLTDLELESFLDALASAYARTRLALDDYLATLLLILLAPRAIQLVAMKVKDFVVRKASDGTPAYLLHVPRAKQRGASPRTHLRIRPIPPQVGRLLERHTTAVKIAFRGKLKDVREAPLFPSRRAIGATIPGLEYHQTSHALAGRIKNALSAVAPTSERTGQVLHLNPQRFRRTLGTRLRSEGHSLRIIAEALDHSDTQNVRVYAAIRPIIFKRISEKMAFSLAPLVCAFAGAPIDTLDLSMRRISDPRLDRSMRRPVGCCGTSSGCDFAAPTACYRCQDFLPWTGGPHREMLSRLLAEHRRIRDTCDERIASALVATIIAVAEVVLRCKSLSAPKLESSDG